MTCPAKRHGTLAAYHAHHCRCPEARRAAMRHDKNYRGRRASEGPQRVDATGSLRRLRALQTLGYSYIEIATHVSVHPNTLEDIGSGAQAHAYRRTAIEIADAYRLLSERPSQAKYAKKVRNRAATNGWLGPLAWDEDEIDNPRSRPLKNTEPAYLEDGAVDLIAIDIARSGARPVRLTNRERREVVRQLAALGHGDTEIAARLFTTRDAICILRHRHGIPPGVAPSNRRTA